MLHTTRRTNRTLQIGIVSTMFALLAAILAWYIVQALDNNRARFTGQSVGYQRMVRLEIDTALVRLKDLSAFVLAGQAERVRQKLSVASRTSSSITDLGYFFAGDGTIETFIGKGRVFTHDNPEPMRRFLARLQENIGLTVSFSPSTWPALMSRVPNDRIMMAQAMPTDDGRVLVTFAVLDMTKVALTALTGLDNVHLVSLRLSPDDADFTLYFPSDSNDLIDHLVVDHIEPVDIRVTRNFTAVATLREHMAGLTSLAVMIGGLCLIILTGAIAIGFYSRMQRRSQHALEVALTRAETSNEAKSVFLANMSHEIRTPLNGILGMAELLSRTEMTKDQRRYAEQVGSSGNTLLALLNDILDLSKLESGQLAIDPVRTALPELVTDIARFYAATAQHRGLSLLLDVDPRLPEHVEVDPTRLRQVLGNLISNALKFTKAGEVVISVSPQRIDGVMCNITFSVSDTGIGIADENVTKLFSRFTQAEDSTTRLYGGSGLGLSICKQICELMGGTIGVASELGRGSVFTFVLPLLLLEQPLAVDAGDLRVAVMTSSGTLGRIVKSSFETRGAECHLFDDHGLSLKSVAHIHGVAPLGAVIVEDGRGIEHAVDLCERLRGDAALAKVPVVLIGSQEACDQYPKFDLVKVKPFNGRTLLTQIMQLGQAGTNNDNVADMAASDRSADQADYIGLRALLVDDNNVNLMFGEEILGDLGFNVDQTNNGQRAVEAAKRGNYDVIFMDCQMPIMDGYTATGHIRELMSTGAVRRVPIIAVTANALKGDRERCLEAGMDSFLTKPFRLTDLKLILESFPQLAKPATAVPTSASSPAPVPAPPVLSSHPPRSTVIDMPVSPRRTTDTPPVATNDQPATATPPATAKAPTATASAKAPTTPAKAPTAPAQAPTTSAQAPTAPAKAPTASAQAPTASGKTPLLDAEVFHTTRRSMKNFNTLVDYYRSDTADYLKTIKEALDMERIEDAVMPAHTIKSSSRIIGAMGLALLAENLEARARSPEGVNVKELQTVRVHMERIFGLTIAAVDKAMAAAATPDAA
ncbi:MAG: hypothetical protein AcusKO_24470 [Acuticoccus sp.]